MHDLDRIPAPRSASGGRRGSPRPRPARAVELQHSAGGWVFAVGAARERLKDALFAVANHEAPNIPPLPEAFQH